MPETVLILGDGQMGLVLADALAARGRTVRLWGPFPEHVAELAATRRSPRLRGFSLPASVDVIADDSSAFDDVVLTINAIPAQYVRSVWQRLAPHATATAPDAPIVSVTKGIENQTLLRPTQVIAEAIGSRASERGSSREPTAERRKPSPDSSREQLFARATLRANNSESRFCVLSGPTIAAELARRLPAAMVAASADATLAEHVQDLFNVDWLRVYRGQDTLGVELAGATKNVIALAAGMLDGMDAGDNAKSALLARGLAEIARLGAAMGALPETFFGIAGVGDLATTCFSPEGRNRTCGERLGRGESLDEVLESSTSVVEGVPTTRSVAELARQHDVDMPITAAVHAILFDGLSPQDAIRELMSRQLKAEV